MKKIYYISIVLFLLFGCDSENAPDCLKKAGANTEVILNVEPFSSLEVNSDLNVIIEQGPEQQVTLTTGENLISGMFYEVIDGNLILRNDNSCSWARAYDLPTIRITHPNMTNIRQAGSGLIESKGTLNFPTLSLISEDCSGDFKLALNSAKVVITSNDVSNYYLSGTVDELSVMFASGDGRFEGADLQTVKAYIFHRGTNDIIVHITDELKGRIIASGDLIYVKTKPTIIDVSLENLGKLIDKTE